MLSLGQDNSIGVRGARVRDPSACKGERKVASQKRGRPWNNGKPVDKQYEDWYYAKYGDPNAPGASERINTFVGHIEGIGKGLKSSIKSYNKTIGSYNHKLLPSQKRLNKLKGDSENLIEKEEIDELPREVQQKLETK